MDEGDRREEAFFILERTPNLEDEDRKTLVFTFSTSKRRKISIALSNSRPAELRKAPKVANGDRKGKILDSSTSTFVLLRRRLILGQSPARLYSESEVRLDTRKEGNETAAAAATTTISAFSRYRSQMPQGKLPSEG